MTFSLLGEMVFKKLNQGRMYEAVTNQVMEAVLRGDLTPNDKLPSEKELVEIFGVSRVTVREAIRSLEQMGIVEVRQGANGGAFIKEVDMDAVLAQIANALRMTNLTIKQLSEVRAALEASTIFRYLPRILDKSHCDALMDNVEKAEAYERQNNFSKRLETNFNFHTILVDLAGNPLLSLMHKLVIDLSLPFFENVRPSQEMFSKTFGYHREIVKVLMEADFERAASMCADHILEVAARISEKSKQQAKLGRSEHLTSQTIRIG
jgi:GntR family transcriptional regulator, transcriptional repressor for pyruvate dehydrogenase complex